jgi:hypothetical protein
VITKTWADPCPRCGGEVDPKRLSVDFEHIVDNPDAVISVPNPNCPYDPDDPDSPDCICTTIINPAPSPWNDRYITVGATVTMQPCGDVIRVPVTKGKMGGAMEGWSVYQQDIPEPGSLGELMGDWARASD